MMSHSSDNTSDNTKNSISNKRIWDKVTLVKKTVLQNITKGLSKRPKLAYGLGASMVSFGLLFVTVGAKAEVKPTQVKQYVSSMKQAANAKNLDKISELIADDVIIKITRNGKSATLNKSEYLKRLQQNWQQSDNYSYSIQVSDVIASGDHVKANVVTREVLNKNGQNQVYITESRATLAENNNRAVLLKAVSQVRID